jgi:hypothetical protein
MASEPNNTPNLQVLLDSSTALQRVREAVAAGRFDACPKFGAVTIDRAPHEPYAHPAHVNRGDDATAWTLEEATAAGMFLSLAPDLLAAYRELEARLAAAEKENEALRVGNVALKERLRQHAIAYEALADTSDVVPAVGTVQRVPADKMADRIIELAALAEPQRKVLLDAADIAAIAERLKSRDVAAMPEWAAMVDWGALEKALERLGPGPWHPSYRDGFPLDVGNLNRVVTARTVHLNDGGVALSLVLNAARALVAAVKGRGEG